MIEHYGYLPENIDFEVLAQQGSSGKTRADLVLYLPNGKAFAVIETKKEDSEEKPDKVRRQSRSYARSEEIDCQYYAYRIGIDPLVTFKIPNSKEQKDRKVNFPFDYTKTVVYAFLEDKRTLESHQKHYQNLIQSTPYELKQIFKRCHDEIWNGGEKNAQDSFDEFSKMLFLKMYDEMENEGKHSTPYFFQTSEVQTDEELKDLIESRYSEALQKKKVNSDNKEILTPLNLNKHQIRFIVEELQKFSLINTDNDPKGLAFETFVEHYMKGEFGQFFTPRNIVDFMVKVSPIWGDNFNQYSTVLDPCCGSGSFLVHSIMNFREKVNHKKEKWQYFANNSVYGVELNDKISVTAKVNLALHDDGHDNVTCSNGLNSDFKFDSLSDNTDLILTNPPFGTKVKSKDYSEKEIEDYYKVDRELKDFLNFKDYDLTRKVFDEVDRIRGKVKKLDIFQAQISSEMLFFELYYRMLRVGGFAGVVIPDGVLTNSTSQFFRDYLSEHFQILAVVSLPQFTFSHYGAGVKSSILMLRKISIEKTNEIKSAKESYLKESVDKIELKLDSLEKEKKELDKRFAKIVGVDKLTKDIKDSEQFKEWKKSENDRLTEEINELKESALSEATEKFKSDDRFQYPIFMAIAETIGYDATGRETGKNDLDEIVPELRKFLRARGV